MPKYAYDLNNGLVIGGIVDSPDQIDPETQYFPNGVLTERPLLPLDGTREGYIPFTGSFAEGTATINVRGGDSIHISYFEGIEGIVVQHPYGVYISDGIANDVTFRIPDEDGEYHIEAHYQGYRVARLKITAISDYPYPV
jgi:hypothetical protein